MRRAGNYYVVPQFDTRCNGCMSRKVGVYGAESSVRSGERVSVVIGIDNDFKKGHRQPIADPGKKIFVGNGIAMMVWRVRYRA
jgi:hypothetical protein